MVKKHATFKWKDGISGFPVSPGSAEALVRWGGKIKYILIDYFLGNICAKNCRNRIVCVKIIANQKWDVFLDTVYRPPVKPVPDMTYNVFSGTLNPTQSISQTSCSISDPNSLAMSLVI